MLNHTFYHPLLYPPALIKHSLLTPSTTMYHLSILSLTHTQYSSQTQYTLHPANFHQAPLPPTASSSHALQQPAPPTPHHPKHPTVSPKICTYHTQTKKLQTIQTHRFILSLSLPSARCRRRGRPPHAVLPPHLQSFHTHSLHPHPPYAPPNPNTRSLDHYQPLPDPDKPTPRTRHSRPRNPQPRLRRPPTRP